MGENREPLLENPKAPAVILAAGDLAWRVIAWLGNFDFIMSMQEEKLATIFESLLKWGWAIILGWAILRVIRSSAKDSKNFLQWEMVVYVGIIAFMAGTLVATYASGSKPYVITGWSGFLDGCNGQLDTSRLVGMSDKYKIAYLCVLQDPTLDMFEDSRVAVSPSLTITGGTVPVYIAYKGTTLEGVPKPGDPLSTHAFLFPKDEDVRVIKKMSDIRRYGGILL